MGYTGFEALGGHNWVRCERGPSWSQNQKSSHWGLVLANETWRCSFFGRGNVIVVEYIRFEVVGASNWVWHKGGSWLEPKMSHRDSVLADKTWGPLFWVEETWVGPGNAAEDGWGWFFSWYAKGGRFDLPVPFPIPPLFTDPLLFPTLSNTPLLLPKTLWRVVYGWHVVVGGGGREKIGGSAPKSSAIMLLLLFPFSPPII